MAGFLNWDIVFSKSYSANGTGDLCENTAAVEELKNEGSRI